MLLKGGEDTWCVSFWYLAYGDRQDFPVFQVLLRSFNLFRNQPELGVLFSVGKSLNKPVSVKIGIYKIGFGPDFKVENGLEVHAA